MPDRSQRLGRYELVKRIGQGGMGVVYLAHDPQLDRNVAIKLLAIESGELRERFGREARAAGSLNHPNIVHVYDVGEDEGRSFIAMEYVAGETLADVINRKASLKLSRKLTITLELCAGLAHAHRMGIVHRDVKPANVMLDESGTVKILDFGLARPLVLGAPGLTRNSQMIGTPHYMAPEQIQGGVIDKRTDVYGVGLVLYELLAYVKAYPGDAPYSVILRVMNEEPEALERLCPDLDPSLPDIVRRASDKIPGRRYDDLSRMTADLNRVLQRLPLSEGDDTIAMPAGPPAGFEHPNSGNVPAVLPNASPAPLASPTPGRFTREEFLRRRASTIDQLLARAKTLLDRGEFDAALEECQLALLHDPDDSKIEAVIREAQRGKEARDVVERLAEAGRLLDDGDLTASELVLDEVLSMRNGDAAALALQRRLRQRRREQDQVAEQAHRIGDALQHARGNLRAGRFESALRVATEALAHDAGNADALSIRDDARAAIEARHQRIERVPFKVTKGPSGATSSWSIGARILAGFRAAARRLTARSRDSPPSTEPHVLLGVSAPHGANSGSKFVARFVAYVGEREIAVKQQLRDLDPVITGNNRQIVVGLMPDRGGRWLVGTPVTVRAYGDYLSAEPPIRAFEWNGQENLVSFSIAVAPDAPATTSELFFEAFIEGVPIAHIPLVLRIGPGASEADRSVLVSHPASTAFASYASKDAPLVALCLSALKHWDPQIDVSMDCLDLTPNGPWARELRQIIPSKDTFLLFWSTNAINSKWVAWELGIAETTRGLAFVRPMPLDSPEVAPPPDQLKHLQFGDRYLMARQGFLGIDEHRADPS